ncbi:nuclear transport factor 2 family protein [Denitratisoma oestradiolicum]|uniref:SnoaL-like domain-containing protein n=1 Tax=Denitratisoma oestradiolicum TaxID=311182 RepID=A0A6S6XZ90_9PROT|nr:nuclear transport factor 2 family protein [Denitratisoma oestradiolicum]TWO79964.1 hypothetical protein CBW56_11630 [Denitratisoma oestradiolicum]CAB1369727.1 conserved protein of unknown function [Denitratisoma oestradiolicum]
MSEIERNKQCARDLFAAISRGDAQAIADSYAEDGVLQTMGHTPISGRYDRNQIRAAAAGVLDAFPQGLEFTLHTLTAEEDRVAVEAESLGTHVSGKTYNNHYHFLLRFRDGKVVEMKEYMDTELVTDIICGGQRP